MSQEESFPMSSRIMIIDDDEDDFWLISDFIQDIPGQSFQVDWCPNYKLGSTAIRNGTHDIYFIDYHLGAKTGIDLLKEALEFGCKEPLILLTGQGNQKIDLEAMRFGAADYLTKSQITSSQLDRCIRYSLERAVTMRETRASEQKFRSIFERSKDAIFICSDQLDFQEINNASSELFGFSPDELLHKNLSTLLADQDEKERTLKLLTEQMEVLDHKIEILTKDQSKKTCILSASLETDPNGNAYIQGIIHDISIFQKVEEIKLQSEKLEAKGMTIRTLAHEIRNPLHNIILSLGFLKSETSSENQEFLNVIERNSKRINDLINELLDSNQYHKMKLEVTSLEVVMREALENATDQLQLSNVRLNFNCSNPEAKVLVDQEKIKIGLLNIIVNAIESMDKGKGVLTITISTEKSFHKVRIQDNGCGMSPENAAKLFEPYFTTKPKGMGLGLAAAQAILQSHKAEVEVSSTLNVGTTFTISFPAL